MTRARDVANLIGSGNYSSTTFTATAGQTAFTIAHTQGFVQVFMNGLLLDETVDYTSNGSAVTLTSGAAAGDEIEVVAYNTFSVGDALNQAAADTRYVNASGGTISGDLSVNKDGNVAVTIETDDTNQATLLFKEGGVSKYNVAHVGSSDTFQVWNYTTNTRALGIDNASRVTMPYQPFFQAYSPATSTAAGSDIVYGGTYHNIGSHYSTSTGIFTAPVAGRYLFTASCLFNYASGGYHRLLFKYNGSNLTTYSETLENQAGSNYSAATISAIFNMSANDTMKMHNGSSVTTYGSSYGHFSGILLG